MSTIPTQAQYEASEARKHRAQLDEIEKAPLSERKEARATWLEALKRPALVAERVGWLLDGSYGKGAYDAAWAICANSRLNRTAGLGLIIAAMEWHCPNAFAREAWSKLTGAEQDAVTAAIRATMDRAIDDAAQEASAAPITQRAQSRTEGT